MAMRNWTPEQKAAIDARGGSVLVSAAAGSGKTAVLVERIVGLMLDENHPVDADRILAVTFSKAAADEIRQRLFARIGQMLEERPEDRQLQRQKMLLGRAQMCTVHAFCGELIRSNFQRLGLASDPRIGDAKELELLRAACAGEAVERFYAGGEAEAFGQLVELLSSGRDDRKLFETLFQLYDFARSHAFYRDWLARMLELYDPGKRITDTVWGTCILRHARQAVSFARLQLYQALHLIAEDEAMRAAYEEAFLLDLSSVGTLAELLDGNDWDAVCGCLRRLEKGRLRPLRGESAAKEQVKALREHVHKTLSDLRDKYFCATMTDFTEDIAYLGPMVKTLFDLVLEFDRLFLEAKQKKNLMDFSDMEQYAVTLLAAPAGEGFEPTELALSVAELYDEILVDECQDSNVVQELLFRAASRKGENLFMVGDVKQSIYRFRQACPELFMEKKKRFARYDGIHFPAKIILGKNFRSAEQVTDGINFFFRQLMCEDLGEIDYDDEEALVCGGSFPAGAVTRGCALRLLDLDDAEGEATATEREACYVAAQIATMLETGAPVSDQGALRPIHPGDICILLRAPSGKARIYQEALTARGIPVRADAQGGFLSAREVAPVLALLRVLKNPLLDIELAACMLSPLFGFTEEELAEIRLHDRRAALYLNVSARADGDAHCAALIEQLAVLRALAATATAEQLIRQIYERTGYLGRVQVMRMGAARRANLLLLLQYARDCHARGYKGLYGFTSFIEQLLEQGSDLAPAAGVAAQADAVAIMSIHRSKGLEFPVVFLCNCAKQFNRMDLRGHTLLHARMGFACMRRDPRLMSQYSTAPMQAIRLELDRANLSEELRMLYVAMTRAKERLIMTAAAKRMQTRLQRAVTLVRDVRLPAYLTGGADSYLDWLLLAAARHPALFETLRACGAEPEPFPDCPPLDFCLDRAGAGSTEAEQTSAPAEPCEPPDLSGLERALAFRYPYAEDCTVPAKMGISEIAKGEAAKSYRFARRPAFLEEGGLTSAQRGTAIHRFMQFADYARAAQNPSEEVARLQGAGFLSAAEAQAVSVEKLRAFFSGALAARIFRSPRVLRELRFLSEAGTELLGQYTPLVAGQGKTAIQGVADCVFVEDGAAVIVDYKSDYVREASELAARYGTQLQLYRLLLAEHLGMPVKECVIYSFALSEEFVILNQNDA